VCEVVFCNPGCMRMQRHPDIVSQLQVYVCRSIWYSGFALMVISCWCGPDELLETSDSSCGIQICHLDRTWLTVLNLIYIQPPL